MADPATIRLPGAGGLTLAAEMSGPPAGLPVMLIGGMGQTRHAWRRVARRLAGLGYRAIAIDMRGHGGSDRAADGDYGFAAFAADVAAALRAIGRPAVLVGASLGGKIALAAAGGPAAALVRALAIVDTVPRTDPSAVADVTRVLKPPPDGFADLAAAAAFLSAARGSPGAAAEPERLRRHLRQDGLGRWHWHWDPAIMARDHGLAMTRSVAMLEAAARAIAVPVLLARCGSSDVVTDDGEAAFRALVPQLQTVVIAGARHMIAGDENDVFADALIAFIGGLRM